MAMFGWVVIIATLYAQVHGLIAHVHALFVSICSAMLPLGYMDSLLLDAPNGEKDEEAIGYLPAFSTGITPEAEIMNGRMAMLGLITVLGYSMITGTSILGTVDLWTG